MSRPAYAIYVRTGAPNPIVFTTADTPRERQQLDEWLSENPELAELVEQAIELAKRADGAVELSAGDL